jgi:hypothetical protein
MDYNKLYYNFMNSRKSMNRRKRDGVYYEKHHIIPMCLSGSNHKDNLVLLTAKEHFIAHRILYKIYPEDKNIALAFWGMCNQKNKKIKRYIPSSRSYEEARLAFLKNNTGDNNPKGFLGKKHSEKTRIIQSISNKGKIYSEATREKIRITKIGKKYSKEVNLKKGKKDQFHNRARKVKHTQSGLEFLTLKFAAEHFKVSRTSIHNWIKNKKIVYT